MANREAWEETVVGETNYEIIYPCKDADLQRKYDVRL